LSWLSVAVQLIACTDCILSNLWYVKCDI